MNESHEGYVPPKSNAIDNLVERLEAENAKLKKQIKNLRSTKATNNGWQTEAPLSLEREALVVCIDDINGVHNYKVYLRLRGVNGEWGWCENGMGFIESHIEGYDYYKVLLLPEKK